MFPVEAFRRTVEKFVVVANALELRFHLTGGSVSSAYGEPRMTHCIDIVVSPVVAKKKLELLISQLSATDFLFNEAVGWLLTFD